MDAHRSFAAEYSSNRRTCLLFWKELFWEERVLFEVFVTCVVVGRLCESAPLQTLLHRSGLQHPPKGLNCARKERTRSYFFDLD
jgi:hypothetical protein